MLLDALSELRELHIVHTNVKLKNLLIKNWLTSGDGTIAEHLQEHPIEYEGEYVLENGDRYLAPKAQPILSALSWDTKPFDAELMTICLVDFGRGVFQYQACSTNTHVHNSPGNRQTAYRALPSSW